MKERGSHIESDYGLPGEASIKLGLKHLDGVICKKRNYYFPRDVDVNENEHLNSFVMLGYYRNPINHVFFNESLIVCSMYSFGLENAWQKGVTLSELFDRTCFLSNLIRREEVLQERITVKTKEVFDKLLVFME